MNEITLIIFILVFVILTVILTIIALILDNRTVGELHIYIQEGYPNTWDFTFKPGMLEKVEDFKYVTFKIIKEE